MKILFWTDGFWPRIGGIETQALQFVEGMQKKGHQFLVLAQRDHPSWKEDEVYKGMTLKRFDFEFLLKNHLHLIREYFEWITRDFQPDVIHLNLCDGWAAFAFILFKSLFLSPVVLTIHAPIYYHNKMSALLLKVASTVHQIACVSYWVLDEIKKNIPESTHKLRVIYNGLAMPHRVPSPLLFSPATLLLLGRFTSEKGFDTAITAFSLLKKRGSSARLLIAGEGCERSSLENQVEALGLRAWCQFTGALSREEVPLMINQATLVVVPSYFETFGLVALEAMQMRRPVIASAVGGLKEVVLDGKTGLLVPPRDPMALCDAIEALLEHPEKAIKIAQEAYEQSLKKFTLQQNLSQYESLYQEIKELL